MLKLNLGDGGWNPPGFTGVDRKRGEEVYPLPHEDGSVDEIRASHVLEHFSHRKVSEVVNEWVRTLKPGGLIKIAVPDFEYVAQQYVADKDVNVQGYLMGGHADADDHHGTIFDTGALTSIMEAAGLVDILPWQGDPEDCSSLPVSLNLCGRKLKELPRTFEDNPTDGEASFYGHWMQERASATGAVMSMPRLAFTDNFFCAVEAIPTLGISLRKFTGAFWGQCLERGIEEAISEGKEYILTVDYDSVYTKQDVEELLRLSIQYPAADALVPVQAARTKGTPLFTIKREDGKNQREIHRDALDVDLLPISTGHFGLTLIKVEALEALPKPWFVGTPNPDTGKWDHGRTDDDIHLWRLMEQSGRKVYLTPRIAIGHAELMIRWPDGNLEADYQHPSEFWANGRPDQCWA